MNVRIFFAIIVVLVSCLTGCTDSPEDRVKEASQYLKSAEQLSKQGQLRASLVQAKNVIQLMPDSAQGYLQISRIYNRIGYYSEVEKLIGNKLGLMPELAYQLAYAYYQRKKYRSALDTLTLSAVPQDQSVRLLKALCYLQLGEEIAFDRELKSIEQISKDDGYLFYAQAKSAQLDNNFLDAESFFKQILPTAGLYIEALIELADIYIQQSRFDAAEQKLTEALSLTTNADTLTVEKARILTTMVQMLVQQGRSGEAYTYQKILANANPQLDFMKNRFDEALEFYAEGDIEKARALLVDLHQSFPNNSNVTTLLGVIAFQQGKDDEAESYLADVVDPETATPGLIQATSLLKVRNDKIDDAITLLKSAVEAQPRNAQLLATYGLAILQNNPLDKEGALALEKSIAMDPKQQRLRLALADRHYRLGEDEQGLGQLETAFRNAPLDKLIAQNYLQQLAKISGEKAVADEIASLKKKNSQEAQVALIEAWWMLELKRFTEVEKILVKKIDTFPQQEKMSAYLLLADTYRQQNKIDAARNILEEYLRELPQSSPGYANWLKFVTDKQIPAAMIFLKDLQTIDENLWQPYFYSGLLQARTNKWDEAISRFDHVLQKTSLTAVRKQVASLYNNYGFQLMQTGNTDKAQTIFLKVLGIDSDDRTALYYYVQIALQLGQVTEAKKIIDQANKESAMYEFLSGLVKEKELSHDEALQYFRSAWNKDAFDLYAEKLYGIYSAQHNKPAVKTLVNQWSSRLPNSTQAMLLTAMLKQEEGDNQAAVNLYEKLLAVTPKNVIALNNLSWLYLDKDTQKAEELASRAYQLAADSADIADTYAWMLIKNQKKNKAIEVLQNAIGQHPDNQQLKDKLAIAQE